MRKTKSGYRNSYKSVRSKVLRRRGNTPYELRFTLYRRKREKKRKEAMMKRILSGVIIFVFLFMFEVIPSYAQKEVTYLSLADYTAAIAGLNVPADMGCEDYMKDLTSRGGVDGVKIKFIGVDTRYDVARGVSAYKRYRR